jgi:methyl-accepting chemotaxis protein PixJ
MAGQLEIFVQEQALAAEQARLLAKVTGSRAFSSRKNSMISSTRH